MPDDQPTAAHMQARGAVPVTIQARMTDDERLSNHATWRVPDDHPSADRLDQLHAAGFLDKRQHANACSARRMWAESGLGRSQGIAAYLRTCRTTGDGDDDQQTAEDDLRRLERQGGVDFQAVIMLVRGDDVRTYMWGRALKGLERLDWLQGKYPAARWAARKVEGR